MARANAVKVDPGNSDALRAWDGTDGEYWVANESIFDNSLSRYQQRFLDAARIEATDRVLDLGCGTGQATRGRGSRRWVRVRPRRRPVITDGRLCTYARR